MLTYRGYYRESWELLKKDPLAMISLAVVIVLVVVAVFAPLIAPYDPEPAPVIPIGQLPPEKVQEILDAF